MVRRRRLLERYALLWLLAGVVLLGLAAWRGGLSFISHAIGIYDPPNALFFVALAFILLLLLHFSSAVSRLSDQTKVLAQRAALLEERLRRLRLRVRPRRRRPPTNTPGSAKAKSATNPRWQPPDAPVGATTERSDRRQRVLAATGRNRSTQSGPGGANAARTTVRARRSHAARKGIAAISAATARRCSGVRATQRTSGVGSS